MDSDDNLELDFQELLKRIVKILKLRKKLGSIVKSNKRNSQVSDLVNRCDEEALISSSTNPSAPVFSSTFKSSITVLTSNFAVRPKDKNVK